MMRTTRLSFIFALLGIASIEASLAQSKTRAPVTLGNVCKFEIEGYREKFSQFLNQSPDEILKRLDHTDLYACFLSYVDIAPLDRCFIRRGSTLENNVTANPTAHQTWERYATAWVLAAAAHNQEAVDFLKRGELNRQILVSIPLEEEVRYTLLEKACKTKQFKEAQTFTKTLIKECLEAYCKEYVELGKIKGIKDALTRLTDLSEQVNDPSFLAKKESEQVAAYLSLKSAGRLLLEKCSKEKDTRVDKAKELLNRHDYLINVLNAECLPKYQEACVLLRKKECDISSLLEAMEDFFTYCPGIPSADHLRFAYTKLCTAALTSDDPSTQAKLYHLGNICARKLYYVLGDAATSDELFEAFLRFRHAAFSFGEKSKERNSLGTAARYYYMRGEHALAFEVAQLEKSPAALSAAASKLEAQADNPELKVPALKDLYYKTALDLTLQKLALLPVCLHNDFVFKAYLHYKRAQNEKNLDKKRAYYQEALACLLEPVQALDKEEPYDQPPQNDLMRQEVAVMYRRAAALYYTLVLTRYVPTTGLEAPKPDLTAFIFDKHDGYRPYKRFVQEACSTEWPFIFDEETQKKYLKEAARCATALVRKLEKQVPLGYLNFADDMLEFATDVLDKNDPCFERYLTLQKEFLDLRMHSFGEFEESEADCKEITKKLRSIGRKTQDQILKGEVYAQALTCLKQARTGHRQPPSSEEIRTSIAELVSWSEDQGAQLPMPSQFKLPLWADTSSQVALFLSFFQDTISREALKALYATLCPAAEDEELTSPSFEATYLLTNYCYKAAWLSMDPELIGAHLLQATRHLEELLLLLPGDTWPTYEHYYLLGLTLEKAASLSASNPSVQRELEERAGIYYAQAKEITQAEDKLKLMGYELHLFGNHLQPSVRQKGMLGVRSDPTSFLAFLRDCINRIESLDIILDETGFSIEQTDSSDEIPEECIDEVQAALCAQTPHGMPNVYALALQSQEKKETVIHQAHALLKDPEAQEDLFTHFLRYASAVPFKDRLYLREATRLSLNTASNGQTARPVWNTYLKHLMTLIILQHPRSCTLLEDSLKHLIDDTLCLESFFMTEFNLSFKQSQEIFDQLKLGQISIALNILKEAIKAVQQKTLLEEILEYTSKKYAEDDDERQRKTSLDQREGLQRLARCTLDEAQKMTTEKVQLLLNAGHYLVQQLAYIPHQQFADPREIEQAYRTYVAARECPGITEGLRLEARKKGVQLSMQLVDYLGDTATTREQLKCVYDEGMSEIKEREKFISGLIGAKYEEERSKESQLMQQLFSRLRDYFNAYFERVYPHPRPQDILNQARAFHALANEVTLDTASSKDSEELRSFQDRLVPSQKGASHRSLHRCFLLAQAAEYYRSWIHLLGSHAAERQLAEAANVALIGYHSAIDAQAPVLRAQFLESFITLQEARLNLHLCLGQAKAEILDTCSQVLSKIGEENPSDLFTKMSLHQRRAEVLHTPKARYKALKKASKVAWQLLGACRSLAKDQQPDPLVTVIIKGQEVERTVSSIQSSIALLALEAAKHAPSIEQKIALIERCLKELAVNLPIEMAAEKVLSKTNWFEIIKAFLRKATQNPALYASMTNTPASSQRVTPVASPFASPSSSPGGSTTSSPRGEEMKSPRTTPRSRLSTSSDQHIPSRMSLRLTSASDLARKTLIGAATSRTSPRSPQTASPRSPRLQSPRSPRTVGVSPRPGDTKSHQGVTTKKSNTAAKLAGEVEKLLHKSASPQEAGGRMTSSGGASPLARKKIYPKLGQPPSAKDSTEKK